MCASTRQKEVHDKAATRMLLFIGEQGAHDEQFVPSLAAGGYIVLQSSDVPEGMKIVSRTVPDIILIDNDVFDRNTDELSTKITSITHARIPLIIVVKGDAVHNVESGSDVAGFVTKPINAVKLMVHLELLFQFFEKTGAVAYGSSVKSIPATRPSDTRGDSVDDRMLKGKRVLVIDDDKDVVAFLADALSREGMSVEIAYNDQDGLSKACQHRPDLILLNIMMPEMDGYQVCRLIKFNQECYHHIPIVILTALGDEQSRTKALEITGADAYLNKPFMFSDLIHVVKETMARTVGRLASVEGV